MPDPPPEMTARTTAVFILKKKDPLKIVYEFGKSKPRLGKFPAEVEGEWGLETQKRLLRADGLLPRVFHHSSAIFKHGLMSCSSSNKAEHSRCTKMLDIADLYSGFVSGGAGVIVGQPLAVVIVRLQISGLHFWPLCSLTTCRAALQQQCHTMFEDNHK